MAAYQAPAGMDQFVANPNLATEWLSAHFQPTEVQRTHLFEHVFPELNHVFDILQLFSRQKLVLLRQGLTSIADLPLLGRKTEDIRELLKGFNSLTEARGGAVFGAVHYARIFGAILWVRDCTRRGQDPVHGDLTPALLADYVEQGQFDRLEDDVEVPDPPKLSENNFLEWEEAMIAKLGTKVGVRDVPLSYVVRRGLPPGRTVEDIQDPAERLIHETTHEGAQYRRDNIAVGQYIKGVLSGQDATAWVENFVESNDGSEMILSLIHI